MQKNLLRNSHVKVFKQNLISQQFLLFSQNSFYIIKNLKKKLKKFSAT